MECLSMTYAILNLYELHSACIKGNLGSETLDSQTLVLGFQKWMQGSLSLKF